MIMAKVHQVTVPIRFEVRACHCFGRGGMGVPESFCCAYQDWVCGILGTLALAAVNIIDKNAVQADSMCMDGLFVTACD